MIRLLKLIGDERGSHTFIATYFIRFMKQTMLARISNGHDHFLFPRIHIGDEIEYVDSHIERQTV